MFKTLANAFKEKDIRNKILLIIGLVLIYRLGCWIPVPGINPSEFSSQVSGGFLELLSSVSGGALANASILALGISPYISASIIVQLLTIAIPYLERLSKLGDEGRKKIATITKYVALVLAIAQAVAVVISFESILKTTYGVAGHTVEIPVWVMGIFVVSILVGGSMFTYNLGEKITEIGIGNGQSLLIFVGILSTAATSLLGSFTTIFAGGDDAFDALIELIIFVVALIVIFAFIVFMDGAERKVKVQYAKQIRGRKMYGGQDTYIPIRVNSTGVMPIIFAMSLLSFPQMIMSIFMDTSTNGFYLWYSEFLGTGSVAYIIITGLLILFFSYFWTQVTFNPDDISRNIQQNGGCIPTVRPGKPTAEYLRRISNRITLFGAVFLGIMAIVPSLVFSGIGSGTLVGAFSATGLLIVVSVAIEFNKALEAQLLMKNYRGFLNR